MPAIEIAMFPLVAGSDIGDPANAAAVAMKASLSVVARQEGCRQVLFGMQIENPANVEIVATWDAVKNHHDFMAGPEYPGLMSNLKGLVSGAGQMHHVDFAPAGAVLQAYGAPVTEVATLYFDGAPPPGTLDNLRQFAAKVGEGQVEGFLGAAAGLTHEEIQADGVKGIGAVIALGWQSVDAHMRFRDSEYFGSIVGLLGGDAKHVEMHHTSYMQFLG